MKQHNAYQMTNSIQLLETLESSGGKGVFCVISPGDYITHLLKCRSLMKIHLQPFFQIFGEIRFFKLVW